MDFIFKEAQVGLCGKLAGDHTHTCSAWRCCACEFYLKVKLFILLLYTYIYNYICFIFLSVLLFLGSYFTLFFLIPGMVRMRERTNVTKGHRNFSIKKLCDCNQINSQSYSSPYVAITKALKT